MKLEYQNGVRLTKHYHEMSPLETAIQRYEEMAKKHYSLANKNLDLTKKERAEKLNESLQQLNLERMTLQTISDVQALLAMYRREGEVAITGDDQRRVKALTMMRNENHHPTELLEKLMKAEGVPKPTKNHTAHHILPGAGQYNQLLISRARIHIHTNGIRINDPANGVYLLTRDHYTPHWSMPKSRGHLKYHTSEYEIWVSYKVRAVKGMDFIKTQLQVIGRLLQQNEPKTAIVKMKGL